VFVHRAGDVIFEVALLDGDGEGGVVHISPLLTIRPLCGWFVSKSW
jgi:hypothetical protein